MNTLENRRVLLVDDTPAIREDFRKILAGTAQTTALDEDEVILFGGTARSVSASFEVDSAFQGAEAIEKVRASLERQRQYALAFVDMRMPPGRKNTCTGGLSRGLLKNAVNGGGPLFST